MSASTRTVQQTLGTTRQMALPALVAVALAIVLAAVLAFSQIAAPQANTVAPGPPACLRCSSTTAHATRSRGPAPSSASTGDTGTTARRATPPRASSNSDSTGPALSRGIGVSGPIALIGPLKFCRSS